MVFKILKKIGAIVALSLAFVSASIASPLYGVSFGVSLENTVVPGSVVNVHAFIKNTGSEDIHFSQFYGAEPFTYANLGISVGSDFDWNIFSEGFDFGPNLGGLSSFYQQFQGVTINSNEQFEFVPFSFLVPAHEALDSVAHTVVDIDLEFNKAFEGRLVWLDEQRENVIYDRAPYVNFTIGDVGSSSAVTFFDALVLDSHHYKFDVPEPSSLSILMFPLLFLVRHRYQNRSDITLASSET